MTSRRRGRLAHLLVASFVVAACSQPGASGAAPSQAISPGASADAGTAPPTPPPSTAWSRALADIDDDGRFSLQAALTLFATAYGPLPGVDVEQDLTGITDRSVAIRAVMAHRDELTPEQLAAIDRALAIPASATTVTIPPVGTVGTAGSHVVLAAISKDQQEVLRAAATSWREGMASMLGRDFLGDITVAFLDVKGEQDPASGAYVIGDAWSKWPGGVFGGCDIRLYSDFSAAVEQLQAQILAHEVFHCFQLDGYRTVEGYATAPRWVIEGQAAWVGAFIAAYPNDHWIEYLQHPTTPLTRRSYDAIGFYAHLAETGTDPWSVFRDMWEAGTNNVAIYTASKATTDAFLDSAASAVVLLPNLGAAWDTGGAGMVGKEWGYRSPDIGLGNGGRLEFGTAFFTNDIKTINVTADMVHITAEGHARLADGVIDTTAVEDAWYCVEGHKCQSECPGDGPAIVFRGTLHPRFLFAMAGGLDGTIATLEGMKFEPHEPCDSPEPTDDTFCTKYRDYVAWATALGEDADVTQALAAEVARRFDDMYPVAPAEMKDWVALVWQIYATFAGVAEPVNIPITGQLGGISKLPDALKAMHAYCGIPWPAA